MLKPSNISGLHAWWDAQQETFNDGDAVGTFTDRAATPHNLTQATAGNKPIFKKGANGINGRNALLFDGVDDYLTTALNAFTNFTALTICMVVRTGADVSTFRYGLTGVNAAVSGEVASGIGSSVAVAQQNALAVGGAVAANTNYRLIYVLNGASSSIYVNGAATTGLNAGAQNIASYRMGATNGVGNPWQGLVGEIFVYNRALTGPEAVQSDRYMQLHYLFDRRIKVRSAGTFVSKPMMIKVGGTFVEAPLDFI